MTTPTWEKPASVGRLDGVRDPAIQRQVWRDGLLAGLRPAIAIVSLLGLGTVLGLMPGPQRAVLGGGLALLLVSALVPGLDNQTRAWWIGVLLPAMCIASIVEQGPTASAFGGLLLSVAFSRLFFDGAHWLLLALLNAIALLSIPIWWIAELGHFGGGWFLQGISRVPGEVSDVVSAAIFIVLEAVGACVLFGRARVSIERMPAARAVHLSPARIDADGVAGDSSQLGQRVRLFAHDTNNALMIIWATLSAMRESTETTEQQSSALSDLEHAASHIRASTAQLHALGLGACGSKDRAAELSSVLAFLVRMLRHLFPATLELVVDGVGAVRVAVGESQLQRALTNLAFNARDAMAGRGTLTLGYRLGGMRDHRLATRVPKGRAVLWVRDTGPGLPDEIRARMFEPFFTTKGAHGEGLGLASVRQTILECEGSLEVLSQPGQGTTFVIQLPLAPDQAPATDLPDLNVHPDAFEAP